MEKEVYYLYPGYIFFSKDPYKITTILGSCVSICLWDSKKRVGGMNHYIYANYRKSESKGISGAISIPYLIKLLVESGSKIEDLEASIIGGASSKILEPTVAEENVLIAKNILRKYSIKIREIHTGGFKGRKIIFDNYTGKIDIAYLRELSKRVDKNE